MAAGLLYTTRDAHRQTGIPERTLRHWVRTGVLHRHTRGRALLIDYFELSDYLDSIGRAEQRLAA